MKSNYLKWSSFIFSGLILGMVFPWQIQNIIDNTQELKSKSANTEAIKFSLQEDAANKQRIDTSPRSAKDEFLVQLKSQRSISDAIELMIGGLESELYYDNLDQLVALQTYLRSLSKEDLFEFAFKWGELSNKK